MKKIIGTPDGTKDRLFAECTAIRGVEHAATDMFRRQGYCEMTTPNVEYYDLISVAGHPLPQESMMKIVDRTGKILVMRPDCTVAMGRVAASKLVGLPLPLRLYYNQTVFRSDDINTGAQSEIRQCGVELIGAFGLRADLEVISMAIAALETCGLQDYHIEISHAGYFDALVHALSLPEDTVVALKEQLASRNITAYHQLLRPYATQSAGQALGQLPRLFGDAEVLRIAKALCADPDVAQTLGYLETIYDVLTQAGLGSRVQFDLGLVQPIEYYTGIIFRGYSRGAASNVLSGGRYDRLIGKFGQDVPAAGFGLDVGAIASCLPMPEHRQPETVVYYELAQMQHAIALVDSLPAGSAMLSCSSTLAEATREAYGLGAQKLIVVDSNGEQEVALCID